MKDSPPTSIQSHRKRCGFTLLEMLMVVAIIGILMLAIVNVPGLLASSRSSTAMQQLLATIESAHARAMRNQETVWLCFLGKLEQPVLDTTALEQFRAYAIFDVDTSSGTPLFKQATPWQKLPTGFVFVPSVVQGTAGAQNLFQYELDNANNGSGGSGQPGTGDGPQDVCQDSSAVDGGGKQLYPTIKNVFVLKFGPLGQIQYPVSGGSVFQIAITQGSVVGAEFGAKGRSSDTIVTVKGSPPTPADCYFVEVHRNTGRSFFLP